MQSRTDSDPRAGLVYVVSNDPVTNGNAVLGYRRDSSGALTPLPGSPFLTGGTGYATQHKLPHFGPFDLDQNLIVDASRTRLFATNGGSDTVAVFDIAEDGQLEPVPGSPFPSGGLNPVSLGLAGDVLYVVNKNEDPNRDMRGTRPNYAAFRVGIDGALTPIASATHELETPSRSPTQALIARGRYLFDADFGSFPLPSRRTMWGDALGQQRPSSIRAFRIQSDGSLQAHPALEAPEGAFDCAKCLDVDEDGVPDPLMFGLQVHPQEPLLYVGFVSAAKMGVYSFDEEGRLSFLRTVPNSGELICWIVVNRAGTRAYTTNNADSTASVYDLADPREPKEVQVVKLEGEGHPYQIALDPSEQFLHVVKHRTFDETPVGEGNALNILRVNADGKLEEVPTSPLKLPVRDDLLARPQGVVAL